MDKRIKHLLHKIGFLHLLKFVREEFFLKRDIRKKEIKKLLKKENPLILEIGCNDGKDSLEFVNSFKKLNLFCFEPDPRIIPFFMGRMKGKNFSFFPVALSNKDGESDLFLSKDERDQDKIWADSSSLKNPIKHLEKFPQITFDKKVKVKTMRLDSWAEKNKIGKIDFIWADVQGAEKELIEGGLNTLNKKTMYLYTEFYEEELYEGQINLSKIRKMLPNFKVVRKYGNNVLLKNKFIK